MSIIKLTVDINEMEEYEPLPNGPYPSEIRTAEMKTSDKQPGGYFVLGLRVDPEDFPADYDPENNPEGATLTYARVQVPDPKNRRTVGPFKALMKAMNLEITDEIDLDEWIGVRVNALVSTQHYQGQMVNNVESISKLDE